MIKIPVEWLEECDSTSRILKEQTIKSQFTEPKVLAAHIQTAGTGRLGEAWQSLAGNLHFSMALPPSCVPEEVRNVMPFAASLIVASWLRRVAGVGVCLKWPNDILLDGKKIAGILCEGSFQGAEFKGMVIGVGINLGQTPVLPDGQSYAVGSLKNLTGQTLDPRMAAESLAADFAEFVQNKSASHRKSILADWSALAIANGHLWEKKSDDNQRQDSKIYYRGLGVTAEGHLRLQPCNLAPTHGNLVAPAASAEIEVTSATHEFVWSGQNLFQRNVRFLVADVGNSQTKIAVIENSSDGPIRVLGRIFQVENELSLKEFVKEHAGLGTPPLVHAISVNSTRFNNFRGACATIGLDVRDVAKIPVRAIKSLYDLKALGVDRLALLEAVHYLQIQTGATSPVMAVSLGTATTIDYVDSSGKHIGGYILAGIQTSLDAISDRGASLPKALNPSETSERDGSWPTTTVQAMERGTIDQTASFLKSERQRLADHCRLPVENVRMLLTGGFSNLVKKSLITQANPKLSQQISADETMTLLGAGILAVNGR